MSGAALIAAAVAASGIFYFQNGNVDIQSDKGAKAYFTYDGANVTHDLSDVDAEALKAIFNGKKLFREEPSCGFSEEISVRFGGSDTFCIARDTCPVIYLKEKGKYFEISEDEKTRLYNLLKPYGFFFPCV